MIAALTCWLLGHRWELARHMRAFLDVEDVRDYSLIRCARCARTRYMITRGNE